MVNVKLNPVEKFYLIRRACSDAKAGVFNPPSGAKADDEKHWYVSPFVWTELAVFDAQRDRLLEKKLCALWVKTPQSGGKPRKMPFGKAIAWLKKQKSVLDGDIKLLETEQEDEIQAIQKHAEVPDGTTAEQYKHISKMYESREDSVKKSYQSRVQDKYGAQVELLTEEIRLIDEMKSKISAMLSRRMLRIWYYYEKVQRKDPSLRVAHMARAAIEEEYDKRITGGYWSFLEDSIKERDTILSKMSSAAHEGKENAEPSTSE